VDWPLPVESSIGIRDQSIMDDNLGNERIGDEMFNETPNVLACIAQCGDDRVSPLLHLRAATWLLLPRVRSLQPARRVQRRSASGATRSPSASPALRCRVATDATDGISARWLRMAAG
jgi:hypothetical protein